MITLPVAAPVALFQWQLDLFCYAHAQTYPDDDAAATRAHVILCNRNSPAECKISATDWDIPLPYTLCESIFDSPAYAGLNNPRLAVPLNIQIGLAQVISQFADDQVLEVTDCDVVHFRPCTITDVPPDELHVSTIYEDWHLKSLSANRHVIAPYFENHGRYYNGGFVPIIGRAKTFKRILPEWIAVHVDILNREYEQNIHWWAGMFALQAACEKARVQMVARDVCYVPRANQLSDEHYIAHYCVDDVFDKRAYPHVDPANFPSNAFYDLVKHWMHSKSRTA